MGFKCPVCLRDFERDREAWKEHIELSHNGLGADAVKTLHKTCEDKEKQKE